jgi:hypothetical protein
MGGYIIGKRGRFTKSVLDNYGVRMRFENSPKVNFVDYKDKDMCVLTGRMDDV